MNDILNNTKKELIEKGYIDQNFMASISKKKGFSFKIYFMGLKNGELMILPIRNIKEPKYDEVKYYKKSEIKSFTYSGFSGRLKIKLHNGKKDFFHPLRWGNTLADLRKIINIFMATPH